MPVLYEDGDEEDDDGSPPSIAAAAADEYPFGNAPYPLAIRWCVE